MATIANDPERLDLTLTRVIDAPRDLVWRAWTEPGHAKHWGPRGFTVDHTEGDLRPGGAWRARLRPNDGGADLWQGGVFREVAAPERLVYTFAWDQDDGRPGNETLIILALEEEGRKTKLTLHQAGFADVESRDGHAGGWGEALDGLAAYVERLK